jgi:hypothetical protein
VVEVAACRGHRVRLRDRLLQRPARRPDWPAPPLLPARRLQAALPQARRRAVQPEAQRVAARQRPADSLEPA